MQPRDLHAVGGDRLSTDRADDVVQLRRDRVQARPIRSSFSAWGEMPNTSSTANARAQSSTRRSGAGQVSRLATSAPITCPWVSVATSRTGQARSTIPARSSRRQKLATTGSAPSAFSTLGGP